MTTDEIIAGMTEAQRDALIAWPDAGTITLSVEEAHHMLACKPRLFGIRPTALGMEVRARLMEERTHD